MIPAAFSIMVVAALVGGTALLHVVGLIADIVDAVGSIR